MDTDFVEFPQLRKVGVFSYLDIPCLKNHGNGFGCCEARNGHGFRFQRSGICDAPNPGVRLLPVNLWNTSGCRVTRRHFRKSGRVSFVRRALPKYSTCIYLSQTVQYNPNMSKTASWAHNTILITMYPNYIQ